MATQMTKRPWKFCSDACSERMSKGKISKSDERLYGLAFILAEEYRRVFIFST